MEMKLVPSETEYDCLISCMLLGAKSVGKTSIICRMIDDVVPEQSQETVGIEISSMSSELPNGAVLKLKILDTGGDRSYNDIICRYFDDVHIVVLVFSMNDITTLQYLTEWNTILKERGITNENNILLVVGNKLDLLADVNLNRAISKRRNHNKHKNKHSDKQSDKQSDLASWNALEHHNMTEKAKEFASSIGAHYIEVSAKSSQNIETLFQILPKLSGQFFDIKPKLIKNGVRTKGESSISLLTKQKNVDPTSCQCIIS
jgi:small GTP-binding protein